MQSIFLMRTMSAGFSSAGTDENVVLVRNELPKAWQSLVVGTFPMSMTASHLDVLNKAMRIGLEANQQREGRLIDRVTTAAAKKGNGVVGVDETLKAIHDGRVQTLLVSENYHEPGFHCLGCGHLTTFKMDACPFCSGEFERISDVVEHAVMDVMQNGGDIEVIHDHPDLQQVGRMGGILRY